MVALKTSAFIVKANWKRLGSSQAFLYRSTSDSTPNLNNNPATKLYLDGHMYCPMGRCDHLADGTQTFCCTRRRKFKCNATVKINKTNNTVVKTSGEHHGHEQCMKPAAIPDGELMPPPSFPGLRSPAKKNPAFLLPDLDPIHEDWVTEDSFLTEGEGHLQCEDLSQSVTSAARASYAMSRTSPSHSNVVFIPAKSDLPEDRIGQFQVMRMSASHLSTGRRVDSPQDNDGPQTTPDFISLMTKDCKKPGETVSTDNFKHHRVAMKRKDKRSRDTDSPTDSDSSTVDSDDSCGDTLSPVQKRPDDGLQRPDNELQRPDDLPGGSAKRRRKILSDSEIKSLLRSRYAMRLITDTLERMAVTRNIDTRNTEEAAESVLSTMNVPVSSFMKEKLYDLIRKIHHQKQQEVARYKEATRVTLPE